MNRNNKIAISYDQYKIDPKKYDSSDSDSSDPEAEEDWTKYYRFSFFFKEISLNLNFNMNCSRVIVMLRIYQNFVYKFSSSLWSEIIGQIWQVEMDFFSHFIWEYDFL